MKSLVFDTSSIISISTNNLLDRLFELKKSYNGEFLISNSVKEELIDNPLKTKRFEFQAVLIADAVGKGRFKFFDNLAVKNKAAILMNVANNIFSIGGKPLRILDRAEIEGLVLAGVVKADAYVVDERTLRLLVEDYRKLQQLLERKFHNDVEVDKRNLKNFNELANVKIIRSVELMTIAFELGLLNEFSGGKDMINGYRRKMLEGVLWGLRLRGCGISTKEINDVLKLERV